MYVLSGDWMLAVSAPHITFSLKLSLRSSSLWRTGNSSNSGVKDNVYRGQEMVSSSTISQGMYGRKDPFDVSSPFNFSVTSRAHSRSPIPICFGDVYFK